MKRRDQADQGYNTKFHLIYDTVVIYWRMPGTIGLKIYEVLFTLCTANETNDSVNCMHCSKSM